jgi:tetratricopeptide (TPR) repeat protein
VAARWLELAIEVGGILGVDPRERGRLAERYATGTRGGVRPPRVLEVLESVMPDLRAIHDPSDEDRELLAQVRAARANMLALDNRIPEARLELREVVDDVPAGVPSVARARAYGALGATYWRAGPVDEAMPVLLAAIDEARLVGDGNVERTALQDLGNAYGDQGEIGLALEYLRESLRQARDAGDEGLRALGANNLGSQMVENGDDVEAIEAVLREGIAVATRSARLRVVSVTEVTLGDLYFFRGLLREAQEHQTLAREAAIALRNELEVDVADIGIGWCRFARGDDSMVAAVDAAHARYLAGGPDTQGDAWMAMWDAWVLARTDLEAAVRSMTAQDWDGASAHPRRELGRFLARAALRVGDEVSLDAGVRMAVDVARRCTGRIRVLEVDWLGALGRREAATPAALASIADEFEALGWPWMAADCLADAALIAARADLDADPFRGKAQALYDAQGIRPMLGPLPERRWIGSAASRAGTAAPSD